MTLPTSVAGIIGLVLLVSFGALLLSYQSGIQSPTGGRIEPPLEEPKKQQPTKVIIHNLKFQITAQKPTVDEFGFPRAIPSNTLWGSRLAESLPLAILPNGANKSGARVLPLRFEKEDKYYSTYKIATNEQSSISWMLTYVWDCKNEKSLSPMLNELRILKYFSKKKANGYFDNKLIYQSDPVVVEITRGNSGNLDLTGLETKLKGATTKCTDGTLPIVQYFIKERTGLPLRSYSDGEISAKIALQIAVVLVSLLKDLRSVFKIVHGNINLDSVWVEDSDRLVVLSDWGKARRVSEEWGVINFAKKIRDFARSDSKSEDASRDPCDLYVRNSASQYANFRDDVLAVFMTVVIASHGNNGRVARQIESNCKRAVTSGNDQLIQEYFEWKRNLNPFEFTIDRTQYRFSDNLSRDNTGRDLKREMLTSVFQSIHTRTDGYIPYDFIIKQLEAVVNSSV